MKVIAGCRQGVHTVGATVLPLGSTLWMKEGISWGLHDMAACDGELIEGQRYSKPHFVHNKFSDREWPTN